MYEKFSKALEAISLLLITPDELVVISLTKYGVDCHLTQEGLLRVAELLSVPELEYWIIAKEYFRCSDGSVNYVAIVDDDFRKEFESRFKLRNLNAIVNED